MNMFIHNIKIDGNLYSLNNLPDNDHNIKTYTSISQLGLVPGNASTKEIFDKMTNGSMCMLTTSEINDPPDKYSLILIFRAHQSRGRAYALTSRDRNDYTDKIMKIGYTGIGLSGEWK